MNGFKQGSSRVGRGHGRMTLDNLCPPRPAGKDFSQDARLTWEEAKGLEQRKISKYV